MHCLKNSDDSGAGSIAVAKNKDGSAATLQNKYIGLHDGENDAYYA